MQQTGDMQMALMFLLGLDWQIARDWQAVRDREKTLDELKKGCRQWGVWFDHRQSGRLAHAVDLTGSTPQEAVRGN